VAKPHRHNTRQTKLNTPKQRPHARMDWAVGLFPGSFPDVRIRRTRMPVGRTSPSTRLGERSNAQRTSPHGDGDSDRDVAQLCSGCLSSRSSTTASTRLQCRPTVPDPGLVSADRSSVTPAVAYDGDLVVSRRTLAPGLVRRADAAPCVLQQQRTGTAVPS